MGTKVVPMLVWCINLAPLKLAWGEAHGWLEGAEGGWRAPLLGLGNFSDSPCLHFLVTSRHPPKPGTQEIGGEPISSPIIRSLKDQFHTTDKNITLLNVALSMAKALNL